MGKCLAKKPVGVFIIILLILITIIIFFFLLFLILSIVVITSSFWRAGISGSRMPLASALMATGLWLCAAVRECGPHGHGPRSDNFQV